MDTPTRYRILEIPEDAAEGCLSFVPYIDALDEAVYLDDVRDDWRCESCNQVWPAIEFACGYCGAERTDL